MRECKLMLFKGINSVIPGSKNGQPISKIVYKKIRVFKIDSIKKVLVKEDSPKISKYRFDDPNKTKFHFNE